jgi:hypothetical protein
VSPACGRVRPFGPPPAWRTSRGERTLASYQLVCEDCGELQEVGRRDARVCAKCRLLRDLTYVSGKVKRDRKCRICGSPFRPLNLRDFQHCGTCTQDYSKTEPGTCGICKKETGLIPRTPVCLPCTKGTETQPKVIRGLRKGRDTRRALNAARIEQVLAGTIPRIRDTGTPARDTP